MWYWVKFHFIEPQTDQADWQRHFSATEYAICFYRHLVTCIGSSVTYSSFKPMSIGTSWSLAIQGTGNAIDCNTKYKQELWLNPRIGYGRYIQVHSLRMSLTRLFYTEYIQFKFLIMSNKYLNNTIYVYDAWHPNCFQLPSRYVYNTTVSRINTLKNCLLMLLPLPCAWNACHPGSNPPGPACREVHWGCLAQS